MSTKERAARNRTINLTEAEKANYLAKCLEDPAGKDSGQLQNQTIHADTFQTLPKLPPSFVDLVIADPPYNLGKTFGSSKFRKMGAEQYSAYTRQWLEALLPLLKPTASVYICCDWQSSLIIGRILEDYLQIQNRITWQREKGRGARTNWKNGLEDIWFATKSNRYTFNVEDVKQRRKVLAPYRENGQPKDWQETDQGNFRDTYPSNFWDDISIPYWSMPENTDHPTQKPEKLIAKLILASSNQGDLVFDPFLGSGTTSVVAKKLGRNYLGIELEPEYCALAEKRLEMAAHENTIQGYSGGVFWARNTLSEQKRIRQDSTNKRNR